MQSVSPDFLAALQMSHRKSTRASVLIYGYPVATFSILDGSVTVDRTQVVRRTCSITLTDPTGTLTPTDASSLLGPFGNELLLEQGVVLPSGLIEYVSLGIFRIASSDIDDSGDQLVITVTGNDRSTRASRNKLADTLAIAAGTDLATAIKTLITPGLFDIAPNLGGAGANFAATNWITPLLVYTPGADRWAEAQKLAALAGMELFFDAAGSCQLQYIDPPWTFVPVCSWAEGPTATVTDIKRGWSNVAVANHFIRDGTGSGVTTPVRGDSKDLNPNSQTYINGPYGEVVDYLADSSITTQTQAQSASDGALLLAKGSLEKLTVKAISNPALDVGDVVTVARARLSLSTQYVIDNLIFPLMSGESTAICRRVTA